MTHPDIYRCYRILGIKPGTPMPEVRLAYRDMVSVWHPDRFANNPRLQQKAGEKLRRINAAYEYIRRHPLPPETNHSSHPEPPEAPEPPQNNEACEPEDPPPASPVFYRTACIVMVIWLTGFGRRIRRFCFKAACCALIITAGMWLIPDLPGIPEKILSGERLSRWFGNLKERITPEEQRLPKIQKPVPDAENDIEKLHREIDAMMPERLKARLREKNGAVEMPEPESGNNAPPKRVPETGQTEKARLRAAESERIRREHEEYIRIQREKTGKLVAAAGGRYTDMGNGVVLDHRTGRMWCLLNSRMETGRQMRYRDAVIYVKQLDTGGYHDWRLPSAAELAGIYMNRPLFPHTGDEQFWTSEQYSRGWQWIARIVRPGKRQGSEGDYANIDDPGIAHAIRP